MHGSSDIAQDAADVVLLNASLEVVVDGIKEGRKIGHEPLPDSQRGVSDSGPTRTSGPTPRRGQAGRYAGEWRWPMRRFQSL